MDISVHIGTSGWSYKHWSGIFYPENVKPERYLEFYSSKFSCVELNSSFYHLPLSSTVTGWVRRTPDSFIFCPKFSRYVTHELKLSNSEEPVKKFFDVFRKLKPKIGPVLIQLPPGLSYDEPLFSGFLCMLTEQYTDYRFAVEVRNRSWINDNFFSLLNKHDIAFVIADSGNRYPYYEAVTASFVFIRFHGREHLYASDYGDDVLFQYAEKIQQWLNEEKEIWIFFNNDFHGYAVKNAERLKDILTMRNQ